MQPQAQLLGVMQVTNQKMHFCVVHGHGTSSSTECTTVVYTISYQVKILRLPYLFLGHGGEYVGLGLQTRMSKPHGDVTPGRTRK